MTPHPVTCTAFEGHRRIASGSLSEVALAIREVLARGEQAPVLVFDDVTSRPVEFDLRGTPEEILARLASGAPGEQPAPTADAGENDTPRSRGRPKLGVVAREVTLLPRHWDWLNGQSGGASVALRKLVDAARLAGEDKDRKRAAQEAVYRFMTAIAGNLPDYEDATRALYADDRTRFDGIVAAWPEDVRDHTLRLAQGALVTHP
ncbi:DUF2239 family protein [Paraburkholderia madseniana]|uniref:DUF2239 family protein n=1 Tax=Paraburkholderia madseniana TaxID=2599607 RepID=A0A6N6WLL5_9BURK|nr:DUF2239 family protein [Paraburkholderia madseniana]KAE8760811.1 DUF2239 family protein [Paraburkholderia madseniana]NPT62977.1 DUF2239 family protein [Paraburkholderia madseniana]